MNEEETPFAQQDLTKFTETHKGKCNFCGFEEKELCEHGYCRSCKCDKYCWLD